MRIGDLLAVRRIVGFGVVHIVVGKLNGRASGGVDRVDLPVVSVEDRVGYLGSVGRVGRIRFAGIVVGEFDGRASGGVDRIDGSRRRGSPREYVEALIGYPAVLARKGRFGWLYCVE